MASENENRKHPDPIDDGRLYAPAALRNRGPILGVLESILPPCGLTLEIASGSGEHAMAIAETWPQMRVQPSDPDKGARESVAAWTRALAMSNVLAPLDLDVRRLPWPIAQADAMICINMVHISPWAASLALLAGAAAILPVGGPLFIYGPFKRDGAHTAPSNARFDAELRARNPDWGVRDLEALTAAATRHGLSGPDIVDMPANNLSLIFRRAGR